MHEAFSHLINVASDPQSAQQELVNAINLVGEDTKESKPEDFLEGYAEVLRSSHDKHFVFLAYVVGSLVERGADPAVIAEPLLSRYDQFIEPARAFHTACMGVMPSQEELEEADEDPYERFETAQNRFAAELPFEASCWATLNEHFAPLVAVFCSNPASRRSRLHWLERLAHIADYNDGAGWLTKLIPVLDNEPVLAIEPATMLGITARMSGVSDNFQLQMLLMDVFPQRGLFKGRRIMREFAELARGAGEPKIDGSVTGCWNLYTFEVLHSGSSLATTDQLDTTHWIWNEGIPADIPAVEGQRVVLLGPPSYERSWSATRLFPSLKADLIVERKLDTDEVRQELDRLRRVTPPPPPAAPPASRTPPRP